MICGCDCHSATGLAAIDRAQDDPCGRCALVHRQPFTNPQPDPDKGTIMNPSIRRRAIVDFITVAGIIAILAWLVVGCTSTVPADSLNGDPADAPESGVFLDWLNAHTTEIIGMSGELNAVSDLMEAGDIKGASDAASDTGQAFTDLYMDAPEDGTPLSNVTNEMLMTCGIAYTAAAAAMQALDAPAMSAAAGQIETCTGLISDATALIP